MDNSLMIGFYNKIMKAKDQDEIDDIEMELELAILSKQITDSKDMMILNLALQVRGNFFTRKEIATNGGGTTIMMVGDADMFGDFGDFDPEEAQLEEFKQQEFEEVKDGNVVSMKDFTKKD